MFSFIATYLFCTFFFIFFLLSCQSSDRNVTEGEMLERLSVVAPNMRLLPDQHHLISCEQYAHCKKLMRAQFMGYEIFLVELENSLYAKDLAKKLNVIHLGQWIFDNIQNEKPVIHALQQAASMTAAELQNAQAQLAAEKKAQGGGSGH